MNQNESIKNIFVKLIPNSRGEIVDWFSNIEQGDWQDLRAAETIHVEKGDFVMVPLGFACQLPKGYEAHIVPRSSTFKHWGLLQTNSIGIVDESYCGNNDQWFYPCYATRSATIKMNDRICQMRIVKKQPKLDFVKVDVLNNNDRGGFGSTGIN